MGGIQPHVVALAVPEHRVMADLRGDERLGHDDLPARRFHPGQGGGQIVAGEQIDHRAHGAGRVAALHPAQGAAHGIGLAARELAEALEVSERTIYRDIADLAPAGVPVEGEAGVGYLMRGNYQTPPLMFDADEITALVLGAPMARIRRAIDRQHKLAFAYACADGATSRRTAWPLGLFFWGETWTLGAWCELRGDYRTFRLDRMSGLAARKEPFPGDGGELLEAYIRVVSGDC